MLVDILIVGFFLGSLILGYKMGFVKSMFKFFSGILSLIFAIEFYKPFSELMLKTQLFYSIRDNIRSNVLGILGNIQIKPKVDVSKLVLDKMFIPNPMKESVLNDIKNSVNIENSSQIAEIIGSRVSAIIVQLISVILIFLLIRILFFVLKILLERVFCLPILKQINKVFGLVLGGIEGIFVVYILLSIVVVMDNRAIIEAINNSFVTKYLYYNNIIIDIIF